MLAHEPEALAAARMPLSDLGQHIGRVARALLGDPNPALSDEKNLRYGSRGSLSIDLAKGTFFDHEANEGGGVIKLVTREKGLVGKDAVEFLREIGCQIPTANEARKIVATYDYIDEHGEVLFQVVRYNSDPRFLQRRPDGRGGWIWKLGDTRRVLYRLTELTEAIASEKVVFIVEGEKDVENLRRLNVPATTNPGGAGKWLPEYSETLRGAAVVILPDNDKAGAEHAAIVGAALQGIAANVRVMTLPGLPEKGDVSDWLAKGGIVEEFWQLAEEAPQWGETDAAATGSEPPLDDEEESVALSEDALALQFAAAHLDDLRYVAKWSQWLRWDKSGRWLNDEKLETFDHARRLCRAAALEEKDEKLGKRLASAQTVAAVERMARSDQRLAATIDQWDRDTWLLNTPAGTVDLRTGGVRTHRREDYITKTAAVDPKGECPRWLSFIDEITGSDAELTGFIQRMLGYSLTGSTQEQCLFFLFGRGANGKSVLLSTVTSILGDFHTTAPIETFTASQSERHPTELAGLMGARLVTAIETEEGRRWAEAKIKSLTGGDPISARFMRQDFFNFIPQFKLIIAGNHKPSLRTVDEAIRRRFHLVPFAVTIPPDKRDQDLPEKLKAEWPGILKWMIEGCLAWQREGLKPPAAVLDATKQYLESEDAIAAWMEECIDRGPNHWTSSTMLFGSWSAWATKSGEFVGSQKAFSEKLEARGITPLRKMNGRGFQGIGIKQTYSDPHWNAA
jgi:putative DNA primase/helicase